MKQYKLKSIGIFIFVVFNSYILYLISFDYISSYFEHHILYLSLIFSGDSSTVGDVSMMQSIYDRLIELPMILYEYWGFQSLIIGVGVYGGSGGLGYPELPMAHNLFVEILAIFGFLVGTVLIYYLIKFCALSLKNIVGNCTRRLTLASSVFLTLVLTNTFSGSLFYHPVIGLIFWFALSEIVRQKSDAQNLNLGFFQLAENSTNEEAHFEK